MNQNTKKLPLAFAALFLALAMTGCQVREQANVENPNAYFPDKESFDSSVTHNPIQEEPADEEENEDNPASSSSVAAEDTPKPSPQNSQKAKRKRSRQTASTAKEQDTPAKPSAADKPQSPATPTPSTPDVPPVSEEENKLVSFEPITEAHTNGKCDLSEYAIGFRTTTQTEVYETERFFVNIEAGCSVPVNLNALLDKGIRFVEDITGLSLSTPSYKADAADKITVYILKNEYSYGTCDSICLNQQDTISYNGNMDSFIGATVQCLTSRQSPYPCDVLSNGYFAYISVLAQDNSYLPCLSVSKSIYNSYEQVVTIQNAEELFETYTSWDAFLYGYQFHVFLHSQYGEDIYLRILEETAERAGNTSAATVSPEQMSEIVKEVTEETVFEKFARWYHENSLQSQTAYDVVDTSRFSRIILFPPMRGNTEFDGSPLCISGSLTLDFEPWLSYNALQYQNTATTLEGTMYISGTATLEFYDTSDTLLYSCDLTNDLAVLAIPHIAYIKISGENVEITYCLNYTDNLPSEPIYPEPSNPNPVDPDPIDPDPVVPPFVTFEPITETHTGGLCDLSEYTTGYRTSTTHEYYETERFFVDIEAGCTVPVNLNALLDKCISYTENLIGMSLDSEYGKAKFGDKITIYISTDSNAYGSGSGIHLHEYDSLFYNGDMFVMIHELTHCIEQRNGPYLGQVLTEGHSTYATKLAQDTAYLPYGFSADSNYSFYEQAITADNAEALFETLSDWDAYLYSYRLSCFLHEQYGADIYHRILNKALEEEIAGQEFTGEQLAEIVKAVTEESVFVKFAEWYNLNIDRFNVYTQTISTDKFSRIPLFAYQSQSTEFMDALQISGSRTLDLIAWRTYVATRYGTHPNTLSGTFSASGSGTLDFYDSQGTLLQSYAIADETIPVSLDDVNYIEVSGENLTLSYHFNYTE